MARARPAHGQLTATFVFCSVAVLLLSGHHANADADADALAGSYIAGSG